jgi:hypothetical protein
MAPARQSAVLNERDGSAVKEDSGETRPHNFFERNENHITTF